MTGSHTVLSITFETLFIDPLRFIWVHSLQGLSGYSSLTQRLLPVAAQWRQQIAQNDSRSGLDLDRHSHAGYQIDHPAVDLHLCAVKRNSRGVIQLLALRLTALARGSERPLVRASLWAITDHGVLRDRNDLTMQQAVASEIEGIDLDLGSLSGVDEADIAVRHRGFNLEPAVARHDYQEGLCRRHHAANRVHRELLHHAVYRSRQQLQPGLLLGLDQVLRQPVRLLLGLGEVVGDGVPIFRH